jgi:hypothetical protein
MRNYFAGLIIVAVLGGPQASAEEGAAQQTTELAANEPYEPSLGDMMARQQMRHIKLWFAARARNWPLADYEVDRLKGGFEDVSRLLGGDTVEKAVGGAIAALEKAVEAKDRSAFTRAFDELTAGCNGCHQTLDHVYIRIQRPARYPYSDQAVAPEK